jgi:hypothetical protein
MDEVLARLVADAQEDPGPLAVSWPAPARTGTLTPPRSAPTETSKQKQSTGSGTAPRM